MPTTNELLEMYRIRWNEINKANNHGNMTIQRSHTQLLALTAQTIELLMQNLMDLEIKTYGTDNPNPEDLQRGEEANNRRLDEVLKAVENNQPIPPLETVAQRIVRESIGKR